MVWYLGFRVLEVFKGNLAPLRLAAFLADMWDMQIATRFQSAVAGGVSEEANLAHAILICLLHEGDLGNHRLHGGDCEQGSFPRLSGVASVFILETFVYINDKDAGPSCGILLRHSKPRVVAVSSHCLGCSRRRSRCIRSAGKNKQTSRESNVGHGNTALLQQS